MLAATHVQWRGGLPEGVFASDFMSSMKATNTTCDGQVI